MQILKWNHGSQIRKKAFRFPMQPFHAWLKKSAIERWSAVRRAV